VAIGAVGGGVAGNVVVGASTSCADYPQTGHYDANGVWHEAGGYYDANGNWVDTRPPAVDYSVAPNPQDYGADVAYTGPRDDLNARESWLESRIQEGDSSGAISAADAAHDFRMLAGIRDDQVDRAQAHDGLSDEDRDHIAGRLDALNSNVRAQWGY
jgi:hypothetical protein